MTDITRAMKAATCEDKDFVNFEYPIYCSNKIDGWRALVMPNKGIVTQSLKPLANDHIRKWFNDNMPGNMCLDGELVTLDEKGDIKEYNDIQSDLASKHGKPDFRYIMFDCFKQPGALFGDRLALLKRDIERHKKALWNRHVSWPEKLDVLQQVLCYTPHEVQEFYVKAISEGHEGIIIRDRGGLYKSGRSTLRQAWMLKRKPWEDAEGIIIRFEEQMANENAPVVNSRGLSERSHSKKGKVPKGTLGSLILDTHEWGIVHCGNGDTLNDILRQEIWDNQEDYMGRIVTFKYMAYGMKNKPRFPKFKGFRND